MIRQAISCDVCGSEKRQTNHWFVAFEQAGELRLGGWTSRNRARPNSKHLCGQTCVHKLVDEYMAQIVASKPLRVSDDPRFNDEAQDDPIEYQAQPKRPVRREPTTPAPRPVQQPAATRTRDEDSTDLLMASSDFKRTEYRNATDSDLHSLDRVSDRASDRVSDRSLTTEYDFHLDEECSARLIPTPEPIVARHRPIVEVTPTPRPTAPSRPAFVAAPKPANRSIIELPLSEETPSFSSPKWRTEAWERERARELRAANNTPGSIASRLRLN